MSKNSKLYKSQLEVFDVSTNYSPEEAISLLQKMPHVKFNETVELALKLGIDPRQSDQNVRGAIGLPNGTGKDVNVVVIADGDSAEAAKAAGADIVGSEELIAKIKGGWLGFDILIATPALMPKVRPLGRVLGPRGLMPNPKTGTVTDDTDKAVKEAKAGRVEYRADKGGCIHTPIGKLSFEAKDLKENFETILNAVIKAKPAVAKGTYIVSGTLSSTMSPGIKLDLKYLIKEE